VSAPSFGFSEDDNCTKARKSPTRSSTSAARRVGTAKMAPIVATTYERRHSFASRRGRAYLRKYGK